MSSYQSSLDSSGNCFIKILIPAMCGGALMGKGGEVFIKAQNDSGTKSIISKPRDYYPGTDERVCLVRGDIAGINRMLEFIIKCINDNYDSQISQYNTERYKQTQILIPNTSVGFLIGKEGKNITEIKKLSGTYIQVSQKSGTRSMNERCVIISGDMDQRLNAIKHILDKIKDDPKLCSFPNVSYDEMSSNDGLGYQYDSGFNSTGFDEFTRNYSNGRNQNYYPKSNNSSQYSSSFQALHLRAIDSVQGIHRTLEVDEAFIGAIIGPKGRLILELQELTDTNITVSKKEGEKGDSTRKRILTIQGMYEDVARVFLLINDKIQIEREKRNKTLVDSNINEI